MNKLLNIYLAKTIVSHTFLVLFALISIEILIKTIGDVDHLGEKKYTLKTLIIYVFATTPIKLFHYFPISLLIGSLMGLGKIASTNELTIIQVSGFSKVRIGIIGFTIAIILGGIFLVITDKIGIPLNEKAIEYRTLSLGRTTQTIHNRGAWLQHKNNYIHIGGIDSSGHLVRIRKYTIDEKGHLKQSMFAKKAKIQNSGWQLKKVTTKVYLENEIKVHKQPTLNWRNDIDHSVIPLLLTDPDELSISELNRYIEYQKANNISPTNYLLALWQKLFMPLSTGVMFLLALPFAFGSQRNASQGKKLFLGILLGLAYYISYSSIGNIILLTGAPPILGALLPIVLFATISFIILWRKQYD